MSQFFKKITGKLDNPERMLGFASGSIPHSFKIPLPQIRRITRRLRLKGETQTWPKKAKSERGESGP